MCYFHFSILYVIAALDVDLSTISNIYVFVSLFEFFFLVCGSCHLSVSSSGSSECLFLFMFNTIVLARARARAHIPLFIFLLQAA